MRERDGKKVKSDRGFATFRWEHNLPHWASEIIGWQNKKKKKKERKKHLARDYSRGEWDSHTIMTGKKFDFNKTVTVCVMKVYAVWNILMQVMSVKNDLDLASILHISLLCDKSSLLYQNASLVTLETNKCHSLAEQQLICNKLAFYLHINFSIILRSWLVNCCVFLFCYRI